jgi:hypothetical protein
MFSVKQDDRVGGGELDGHGQPGGDFTRLGPVAIMHPPLLRGQWITERAAVHLPFSGWRLGRTRLRPLLAGRALS